MQPRQVVAASPETPNVPLPIEGDQGLALLQLISAARAIVRIVVVQVFAAGRVGLALRCRHCGRPRRCQLNVACSGSYSVSASSWSDSHRGSNARLAKYLLAGVGHLGMRTKVA